MTVALLTHGMVASGAGGAIYISTGRLRGRIGGRGIDLTPTIPRVFAVALDLTVPHQDAYDLPRLYPGDAIDWRFQVRDEDDVAMDLTGFNVTWTARRKPTDPAHIFRRRSTDAIAGASPATNEIVLDAQATEDTVAYSGRGWFSARFRSLAVEEAELLAAVGKSYHDIVLEAPDGTQVTYAVGVLEIPYRQTKFVDVP